LSTDGHTNGDATRSGTVEPLACPTCAKRFPLSERFCADCEMPLVYVGRAEDEPITGAHERAAKVRPEYATGKLVKVASASTPAEGDLILGILLDQGIPARTSEQLASVFPTAPREILVPESAYEVARELVASTGEHASPTEGSGPATRLALGILIALAAAAALVWAMTELLG
jgi:hypothetical protein